MKFGSLGRVCLMALGSLLIVSGALGVVARAQIAVKAMTITITVVPRAGAGGPEETEVIPGKVTGEDPSHVRVVVYAFAGGNWWVQPTTAEPLTDVNDTGEWTTETHLGTSYTALLVKPSYRPRNVLAQLPPVGGEVIAVDRKAGK